MSMNFKTLAALCAISMALTGCNAESTDSDSAIKNSDSIVSGNNAAPGINVGDIPTHEVKTVSEANCAVEFSADKASVSGNGASVSGTVVTISSGGIYAVSGECANGKILVDAPKNDVCLVLNGVKLTSRQNSVIECSNAKTLIICTAEGTENTLADSAEYSLKTGEEEPDAAIFSKADLAFTGSGKLSVTGNCKDGIKGKDSLSIEGGVMEITATDDGITARDCAVIRGGEISITANNDGIKTTNDTDSSLGYIVMSDGKLEINAGGDEANAEISVSNSPFDWDKKSDNQTSKKGIKAVGNIQIDGGEINVISADDSVHSNASVTVGGGKLTLSSCDDGIHADENLTISGGEVTVSKSYEGLEGKNIDISGGVINVKSADDGLNAAGGDNGAFFGFNEDKGDYYISISSGEITVDAAGDGIDSNGAVAMSGGVVTVFGPTNSGNGALDYEKSFAVSGGTLIALGSRGMAQAPSTLAQPCLSIYGDVKAGGTIEVRSGDKVVLSVTARKDCQSLIFTSDKLKSGEEYGIYVDGTLLTSVTATDGISGDGATGEGFHQGGGQFGGGGKHDGNKIDRFPDGDFSKPFDGSFPEGSMPDGNFSKPFDGSFPDGTMPQKPGGRGFVDEQ